MVLELSAGLGVSMKNLFVTGGTSGIGLECVKRFSPNCERIVICGRDFNKLETLGITYDEYQVDFKRKYINFDNISFLPIFDTLLLAAGYVSSVPVKFHDSEGLTDQIHVNLVSQINILAELYKNKKITDGASVVLVGSLLGPSVGIPAAVGYAASKAGMVGAIKVLALEMAKRGIRVNVVSPGMVETPLTENLVVSEKHISDDKKRYPLGKCYIKPFEVADTIEFLFSNKSSAITGQNIILDRGYTLL